MGSSWRPMMTLVRPVGSSTCSTILTSATSSVSATALTASSSTASTAGRCITRSPRRATTACRASAARRSPTPRVEHWISSPTQRAVVSTHSQWPAAWSQRYSTVTISPSTTARAISCWTGAMSSGCMNLQQACPMTSSGW